MKKPIFVTILICAAAVGVCAQKIVRTPAPIAPRSVPFKTVTEISAAEWQTLAATLEREEWRQAAQLAASHLQSLKTENEKKQMARLRYIHLFSIAGQILAANTVGSSVEAEKGWAELERVIAAYVNKEFVLPARPFAADCEKKLNVVCQVKDTPNTFRTTATNKEGSGIHSFDYVQFDQAPSLNQYNGQEMFLGGTLRRVDYNEDKAKPWILRLFFNNGFVSIAAK